MLTDQDKRDFLLSTIRPMADHTTRYVTQFVGVIDEETGELRGSGFYCTILGRQAVVTANHVIDQAAETGRFQSINFTRGSGERPVVVPGVIHSSDEVDLAIYFPDRKFPIGESKAFWPEDRIDGSRQSLSRDYLFVHGFPNRFSRFSRLLGNALVSEPLAYGAMMRLAEEEIPAGNREKFVSENPDDPLLPPGFLKPHQFALNFSRDLASFVTEEGHPETGSDQEDWFAIFEDGEGETFPGQRPGGAYGLSGSPVWRIGIAGGSRETWTPARSVLVGIVTDWNPELGILIATSAASIYEVEGVRKLIRDDDR